MIREASAGIEIVVRTGWCRKDAAQHRLQPTWLIGALFKFLARILVHFPATALTPQPLGGSISA